MSSPQRLPGQCGWQPSAGAPHLGRGWPLRAAPRWQASGLALALAAGELWFSRPVPGLQWPCTNLGRTKHSSLPPTNSLGPCPDPPPPPAPRPLLHVSLLRLLPLLLLWNKRFPAPPTHTKASCGVLGHQVLSALPAKLSRRSRLGSSPHSVCCPCPYCPCRLQGEETAPGPHLRRGSRGLPSWGGAPLKWCR